MACQQYVIILSEWKNTRQNSFNTSELAIVPLLHTQNRSEPGTLGEASQIHFLYCHPHKQRYFIGDCSLSSSSLWLFSWCSNNIIFNQLTFSLQNRAYTWITHIATINKELIYYFNLHEEKGEMKEVMTTTLRISNGSSFV